MDLEKDLAEFGDWLQIREDEGKITYDEKITIFDWFCKYWIEKFHESNQKVIK